MKSETKRSTFLVGFSVVVGLICFMALKVFAEPHWNAQTTFMAQDNGDSMRPFTVSVGTTTPVRVYYSTQTAAPQRTSYASPDRQLVIENLQAFDLYCGTFSTVSATTGPRFKIYSTTTAVSGSIFQTYAALANIYCIYESAAGSGTKEVIGYVEYDSGD